MNEQMMNVFATLGFQLEEMEGFGYGFQYEGINYLFMPNDEEDFLNIGLVFFSSLKNLKLPIRIAPLLPAVIIPA